MSFFKNIFFAFTKKERVLFLMCSAAAIVSFVVVISMVISQATKAIPTQGGEYVEGMTGQPEYVNPVTAQSQADLSLVKLVYANIPDLANNISPSADGLTWTVHLKSGLTWQDGQKITSDDVIFTVQSIQNHDANSPLYTSWQGVSVSRVSELELTFTLSNPYAFFSDDLTDLYVIPKHIFADVPPGNWRLSNYNLKPIGSGPYQFVSYDEQTDGFISAYHLAAWNGYAGQKALIKNFNIHFFPNEAALIKSFNTGSVDGLGGLSTASLENINRPYDLFTWRTTSYYAVFWNQSKNLALQDPAVRAALSAATDRNTLITAALAGKGVADYGPIPQDAAYASSTATTPVTSSIAYAEALLDQAGWTLTGSSSVRSKLVQKTTVPLIVNLTVPDIDFLVTTAQTLQTAWQSIGIQTNIATDTPANLITTTVKNRSYESLLFGNVLGPSSDLYSFWDSSQRFSPGLNLAIYQNKKVDALVESARQDPNNDTRAASFATAQATIAADNPALFLYSTDDLYVTNKNVRGITTDLLPDPSDRLREVTGWYLNTTQVLK